MPLVAQPPAVSSSRSLQVAAPVHGARSGGATGFFKGLGAGVLGGAAMVVGGVGCGVAQAVIENAKTRPKTSGFSEYSQVCQGLPYFLSTHRFA